MVYDDIRLMNFKVIIIIKAGRCFIL